MKLEPNIGAYQKQAIVVSAQALQSLSVLQFSQDELQDYLREQAERNPFIELSEPLPATPEAAPARPGALGPSPRDAGSAGGGSARGGMDIDSVALLREAQISLRDHLRAQAGMTFRDPKDMAVAIEIVESLDADGYFRRDPDEIAEMLGASQARIEAVLCAVQRFDPAGIAARDLAECLRLQLEDKGRPGPAMRRLLDNLPLLAEFNYARLARLCGVNLDEISVLVREIRDLDPRPGRRMAAEPTLPALPDIVVNRQEDGSFAIELSNQFLPRVLVNREYYAEVKARSRDKDEKRFVMDCMQNAGWLVKNLDQRAQTILRVAAEIVARQEQFLLHGVEHLRPLNLRDVADAVGIHESTVSRAIANKFMMTSRGMFELKYFFANSISASEGGEDFSAETVRHRIRQIVDAETAAAVLSDDAIVDALRAAGIDIARRTVAKYREMMRIPSSLQRRKMKLAAQLI